jgi:electron transfer flavoprotein alpha subunit
LKGIPKKLLDNLKEGLRMYCGSGQGSILILAEHRGEKIDSVTFQLASKGRQLADALHYRLDAILIGDQLESATQQLLHNGFDTLFVADHQLLEPYNAEIYSNVISDFLRENMPSLFLFGYTYLGMEVGPAVAARLGITLASNCVGLELSDGRIIVTRPMFGGTVHTRLEAKKLPMMISIQKGVLPIQIPNQKPTNVVRIEKKAQLTDVRIKVAALLGEITSGVDITKSDVVVAVGRGIGENSGLELAKELAHALNGVVACSRPIADWGWLPPECQVGISGKTIQPKVYIACGISGASQHISGMRDSQMIIAVNKDPNAPIFRVAHYGIVGDIYKVVPALLTAVKESPVLS